MNKRMIRLERSFCDWTRQSLGIVVDYFLVSSLYRIRIEITDFDSTNDK